MAIGSLGSSTFTTWKRRVSAASFSKYFFIFGPCGGGDGAQFAARQGGLQQIGRVVLSGRAASANHGVRFVDKQDDRLRAGLHFIDHAAQAILELALHARAGLQQAKVERAQRDTFERRRHIARRQPDREAFNDRGFADAGLTGHDRIVLPPPRQDIDHLTNFRIASEDRIDLAGFGLRGEIDGELFQCSGAARPRHAPFRNRGTAVLTGLRHQRSRFSAFRAVRGDRGEVAFQ